MATAPEHSDDMFDRFLSDRGHETAGWETDYNKKRCPDCGGIHEVSAIECSVCGWAPDY